jgi:DUF1680 family protein
MWASDYTVSINGEEYVNKVKPGNYLPLHRIWNADDVIMLDLPMHPKFVVANPYVESDGGRIAITRGPLVYCLESLDQGDVTQVADLQISPDSNLEDEWDENLLGGIIKIKVDGFKMDNSSWEKTLYKYIDQVPSVLFNKECIAIPYYLWANREASSMCVWCGCEGSRN